MSVELITLLVVLLSGGLLGYFGLKTRQRFRDLERKLREVEQRILVLKQFDKLIENQGRLLGETRGMLKALSDGQAELAIMGSMAALGFRHPLFLGGWTIDAFLAREILTLLEEKRPKVVLELGSGASTVFIATALQKLGLTDTRHIAVDHLERYLDATRRQLELAEFPGRTELWLCPLGGAVGEGPPWYQGLEEKLAGVKLDLVLVDGPPGSSHPRSRQPALDVLEPMLSEGAVLLLDDAIRPEEKAILEAWQQAHPEISIERSSRGHGHAVVRRSKSADAS